MFSSVFSNTHHSNNSNKNNASTNLESPRFCGTLLDRFTKEVRRMCTQLAYNPRRKLDANDSVCMFFGDSCSCDGWLAMIRSLTRCADLVGDRARCRLRLRGSSQKRTDWVTLQLKVSATGTWRDWHPETMPVSFLKWSKRYRAHESGESVDDMTQLSTGKALITAGGATRCKPRVKNGFPVSHWTWSATSHHQPWVSGPRSGACF